MGERKKDGERQISDSKQGGELRGRSPWTQLPGQGLGARRILKRAGIAFPRMWPPLRT